MRFLILLFILCSCGSNDINSKKSLLVLSNNVNDYSNFDTKKFNVVKFDCAEKDQTCIEESLKTATITVWDACFISDGIQSDSLNEFVTNNCTEIE